MKARAITLALVPVAVFVASCADNDNDLVKGKTLFAQKCGSCHALSRAGTKGVQGPDLDASFAEARRDGMSDATIEGIVYGQIGNVRRGSIMPPNLVTGADRKAVAAYVGRSAAKRGQDEGQLAQAGQNENANKTTKASGGKLQLDADPTGSLAFTAGKATAPAGALRLVMKNGAPIKHNIAVQGAGIDKKGAVVGKGGTSAVDLTLKKGKYTFLCTVPGHAEGGMKGTLTVN